MEEELVIPRGICAAVMAVQAINQSGVPLKEKSFGNTG